MKLLYVTNGIAESGGLERVLSIKASMLADKYAYEVHILVLNDAHRSPFYEFSSNIHFHSVNVSSSLICGFLQYRNGIQQTINTVRPDIVSVCDDGLKGFFLPRLISTDAKWIYERHASIHLNTNGSAKGRLIRILMRSQVSNFHKFVVLTRSNVNEWKQKDVVAIPNPLSFETADRSTVENKSIIAVGSHSYNKGYDMLVEIWKNIEKNHREWSLHIYGKIDSKRTFVRMANEQQLKNIYFHKPVRDIKSKYLESSIFVLPSRSEGFGMVLIEAMECGVPCVSFDCPSGPGDILTDGQDGYLIIDSDVRAFQEAVVSLIQSESKRKALGVVAKKNAQRYSAIVIVEQWNSLFKNLTK